MTRLRSAPVVVALALCAGCGSTVSGAGTSQLSGAPDASGLTAPTAPAGAGGSTSLPDSGGELAGPAAPGGVTGPGSATPAPGVTVGPGGQGGRPRAGQVTIAAPGITATTIYIGMEYSSSAAATNQALGAGGASASYDERNVLNAVLDYINDHGGVAGRKLEAIYYDLNVANNRDSEDQTACSKFTEDNKVFAIVGGTDVLRACAEKAGAVAVGQSSNATADTMQRFPHYVDPIGMAFERLGQVTVNGLYNAKYFQGKLGLITWDDASYHRMYDRGYAPALRAHHISLATDPVFIAVPESANGIGEMSAGINSAVTKFQTAGVDHVIIQDGPAGVFGGAGLTLEVMNTAKSQRYYPRYGGNRYNSVGAGFYPKDEMDHMLAVTDADVTRDADEGWQVNQARETCYEIQKRAGYPVKESNANDTLRAAGSCDTGFMLRRVLDSLSTISADAFVQGVQSLHTSFHAASVYGTNLFPGRRDGSDYVRVVEYVQSCDCLKYQGPPYNVG